MTRPRMSSDVKEDQFGNRPCHCSRLENKPNYSVGITAEPQESADAWLREKHNTEVNALEPIVELVPCRCRSAKPRAGSATSWSTSRTDRVSTFQFASERSDPSPKRTPGSNGGRAECGPATRRCTSTRSNRRRRSSGKPPPTATRRWIQSGPAGAANCRASSDLE